MKDWGFFGGFFISCFPFFLILAAEEGGSEMAETNNLFRFVSLLIASQDSLTISTHKSNNVKNHTVENKCACKKAIT